MAMTPADREATRLHLFGQREDEEERRGYRYTSGFLACLRDARSVTGRDEDTGEVRYPKRLHNWLGAVGYIVLLDQIGDCFRPGDVVRVTGSNTIEKALVYWAPEIDEDKRRVVYALRNALAHDYSLYNHHPRGDTRYDFLFTLDRADRLVEHAERRWDGNYASHNPEMRTTVSVVAFGRLVEQIVDRIRAAFEDDRLQIELDGGVDELTNRYGMSVPNAVVEFYPVAGTTTGASVTYEAPLPTADGSFLAGGIPPSARPERQDR
jgi:hypothetical protein